MSRKDKMIKDLNGLRLELGLLEKAGLSEEAKKEITRLKMEKLPLPEGVSFDIETNEYYRLVRSDISEREENEVIGLTALRYLKMIRNCAVGIAALLSALLLIALTVLVRAV